jgi:aspartate aminotransferase
MKPSNWLRQVEASPTVSLSAKAMELRQAGHDVINLAAGEPDFDTPDFIREAAHEAIRAGHTHYTPAAGIPPLRKAIAERMTRRTGRSFAAENIAVTAGAKLAVYLSLAALLEPGDEVLVPAPYWVSYPAMVNMLGAQPCRVWAGPDQGFKVTAGDLQAALTPRTRVLIFNSPSNPTGADYSEAETRAIAEWAAANNIWILSDEIYADLRFSDTPYTSILSCDPRGTDGVLINDGFSKSFAMTGWRLGFVAATKEITSGIIRVLGQTTSNAASISQYAALAAATGPDDDVVRMCKAFQSRRDAIYSALNNIPGLGCNLPDGAFYFFLDVKSFLGRTTEQGQVLDTSEDLCAYLLAHQHVALVPGEGFGAPGFMRLSYATDMDTLKLAVSRLKTGLGSIH